MARKTRGPGGSFIIESQVAEAGSVTIPFDSLVALMSLWRLRLASGETIYSYEQRLVRYDKEFSHRRGMAKWGALLGLIVTPVWFVRRKRSKGDAP